MPTLPDLDDINQTVIYIPYKPDNKEDDEYPEAEKEGYNPFKERDLRGGHEARLDAYRAAWQRCLTRVQCVIDALHAPIIDEIVHEVEEAYEDVLPGLPYPELPVFAISGSLSGSSLINDVSRRLETQTNYEPDSAEDEDSQPEAYVVHLTPSDCPNIMSCMKALVTGFVDRPPDGHDVKRKATTSLASYDIALLDAWYRVFEGTRETSPRLVVFMHGFEQFDESVVEDMFIICSERIPDLPLVFILSLSSPPSPSYLHSVYPRSMLALLRIDTFSLPSGTEVLEKIVAETFFDLDFEPDVMVGPATLDFLADFFTRHTSSIDTLLTILQLAYLKHFDEPLTAFVHDELLGTNSLTKAASKLATPESSSFLDYLLSWSLVPQTMVNDNDWSETDVFDVLASVRDARAAFVSRLRGLKLALGVLRTVQRAMLGFGYRSAETDKTYLEMMSAALKGQLGREAKYLGMMTKKLPDEKLIHVAQELTSYLRDVAGHFDPGDLSYSSVVEAVEPFSTDAAGERLPSAAELGNWLTDYLDEHLTNLEDLRFWEIWFTGSTPFPSELINPSTRAGVVSGLLNPYDYIPADKHTMSRTAGRALWELPDASILFRRYLEAGRLINVYDWYESFAMAIDNQRKHMEKHKSAVRDEGKGEDEEDEEKWKMHVQARFINALHQLDFLGFVRQTGRKADHVVRTVFDLPE